MDFKEKWVCQNNYSGSLNDFGFIMADNQTVKPVDERFSRVMDGPRHTVLLNILSSSNIFRLKKSILKINFGGQSNIRMEDEGGGDISLNMHLNSAIYNLQSIKVFETKTELIISNQGILQNNTNFGKRKIVPDANISETGISVFLNQKAGKYFILEGGIGGNYRRVEALLTENVNTPDREIQPFDKSFPSLNGMLGLAINPHKYVNIKLCGSTGFRAGNLAELSSNGLHEGIFQYEIGDPNLKPEQNFNSEISVNVLSEQFGLTLAAFDNNFNNYIYLAPTTESFYGLDVFRYRQNNASLYGGEAAILIKPNALKGLELSANYSTVTGMLFDGSYLPFIPADKINSEVRFTFAPKKKITGLYIFAGYDYVFDQLHPAENESSTRHYELYNAGIGAKLMMKQQSINISLTCNNILNTTYDDHLSRFKAYGIHNIGRNIVLNLNIPFNIR